MRQSSSLKPTWLVNGECVSFDHVYPLWTCSTAQWLGVRPAALAGLGSDPSSARELPHLHRGHGANGASHGAAAKITEGDSYVWLAHTCVHKDFPAGTASVSQSVSTEADSYLPHFFR